MYSVLLLLFFFFFFFFFLARKGACCKTVHRFLYCPIKIAFFLTSCVFSFGFIDVTECTVCVQGHDHLTVSFLSFSFLIR